MRAANINRDIKATGGGAPSHKPLSDLELRVLGLIGSSSFQSQNEERGVSGYLSAGDGAGPSGTNMKTPSSFESIEPCSTPKRAKLQNGSEQYAAESLLILKSLESNVEVIGTAVAQMAFHMENLVIEEAKKTAVMEKISNCMARFLGDKTD